MCRVKGQSFIVIFKQHSIRWFMKMSVWSLACRQSVFQWYRSEKRLSEFYPQDGGESQLALKLRQYHPMYRSLWQSGGAAWMRACVAASESGGARLLDCTGSLVHFGAGRRWRTRERRGEWAFTPARGGVACERVTRQTRKFLQTAIVVPPPPPRCCPCSTETTESIEHVTGARWFLIRSDHVEHYVDGA